jgi:hypothetical protein
VTPCVVLGYGSPVDIWCDGCRLFTLISDNVQQELDEQAARRRH